MLYCVIADPKRHGQELWTETMYYEHIYVSVGVFVCVHTYIHITKYFRHLLCEDYHACLAW
jgi:hypothetical protein